MPKQDSDHQPTKAGTPHTPAAHPSQHSWHWALGASLHGCRQHGFQDKGSQFLILSSSPASLSEAEPQARGRWLCLYCSQRSQPLRMPEQEQDGKHPSWNTPPKQHSSTLRLGVTFGTLCSDSPALTGTVTPALPCPAGTSSFPRGKQQEGSLPHLIAQVPF